LPLGRERLTTATASKKRSSLLWVTLYTLIKGLY
jgi:hypothetical protein